jgi:peptidoglycan hydrolase-like protein with peptidoglycan-binding domain
MLRNGSTGEEVTALQKTLMAKGINPGPIDGIFGPKTEDAVKRFQDRAGLEADGIVGPKTFAALEGKAEKPVADPDPAPAKAAEPEDEPKETPEQPDERDLPKSAF